MIMVQRGNTPDQFFSSVVTAKKNRIETLKDVYKAVSVLKKVMLIDKQA